ncbi:nucleotidyl transferase AbiEii/AbiGii toxin family protein [bacterium]|nr:nucleotidyl transferase AbiEii/AbiGii toxin family protein [bacterium]
MISQAHILAWQKLAPWQFDYQIEQDLILSRILVEIYNDEVLREQLLFRGGTALTKLFFEKPFRYSEDLDFVQTIAGPIKPVVQRLQKLIDPWMGKSTTQTRANGFRIYYRFQSESDRDMIKKIKIEINTREHFTVFGVQKVAYAVDSPWYRASTEVQTYSIDELAGTKLRALYQRKKGRDLFDIYRLLTDNLINPQMAVEAFQKYLQKQDLQVKRDQYTENIKLKLLEPVFRTDVESLLVSGVKFDPDEAFEQIESLIRLLPE